MIFPLLNFFFITGSLIYLGCYNDDAERALPNFPISNSDMTRELCWKHCVSHKQRYAAVQYATECFCGDSDDAYDRYGKADDSNCNRPCSGNSEEICGGSWNQNVFELGKVLLEKN